MPGESDSLWEKHIAEMNSLSFKPAEFGFIWDDNVWQYINPVEKSWVWISYHPEGEWEIAVFSPPCPECGHRVWDRETVFRGRIPSQEFGLQVLEAVGFFELTAKVHTASPEVNHAIS